MQSFGTTITKAVRTVTWTAGKGTRIGPGEYQEFSISAGPLPAAGPILFPTEQVYSDGTVVAWDEPTPASGPEPEHPAPAFEITAAEPGAGAGDDSRCRGPPPAPTASPEGSPSARWRSRRSAWSFRC